MNQNAKISNLARSVLWPTPTLDDLGRFLSHDLFSPRSFAPAAERHQNVRKCKISIISGFPQAIGERVLVDTLRPCCDFANSFTPREGPTNPSLESNDLTMVLGVATSWRRRPLRQRRHTSW